MIFGNQECLLLQNLDGFHHAISDELIGVIEMEQYPAEHVAILLFREIADAFYDIETDLWTRIVQQQSQGFDHEVQIAV